MDVHRFVEVSQYWEPKDHHGKQMKKLKKQIEDKYQVKLGDYHDLHKWSVEHLCEFWAEMWEFFGIVYSEKFERVIDLNTPMRNCPKWFEGAKLNFAENMLKYRDDRVALVQEGTLWKIPVILSKPRQDLDKKKAKCTVLDVMFHPKAIELSQKNSRFKGIIEDTAREQVKAEFGIDLSSPTTTYPKMKYKGKAPPVVLRKSLQNNKGDYVCEPIEKYVKHLLPKNDETIRTVPQTEAPKYCVKYRDILDLKDYSLMGYTDRTAPKEIIVEVQLPQVQKASEVELDILERKLLLKSISGVNHCYRLNLDLNYAVDTDTGAAKFDKMKRVLTVTLPVKERGRPEEALSN